MCNVGGELANESELMSLPIRNRVAGFEKSTRQRFLVRKNLETAAFEEMTEFNDRRVDRQKFEIIGRVTRFGRRSSLAEKTEGLEASLYNLVDRPGDGLGACVGVDLKVGAGNRVTEKGS